MVSFIRSWQEFTGRDCRDKSRIARRGGARRARRSAAERLRVRGAGHRHPRRRRPHRCNDVDRHRRHDVGAPDETTTTGSAGNIDFEAEVGDCVRLGGTTDDAEIDHADCGSAESNYKIISKEASSTDCISDADSYYYETLDGVEQGALCLDVDWVVGGCMDLSGEDPRRIDCTASTTDGVRVVEIQQNKTDVNDCPSSGGFVYDVRRFVVCTEDL